MDKIERNTEKILLGNSIHSLTDDNERPDSTLKNASDEFDIYDLISTIGTDDFKINWIMTKNKIKGQTIERQRECCYKILSKIKNVYNFTFPQKIEIDNLSDINDVYELLEFIHYDCIDFFSDIWKFLKVDLLLININEFCVSNSDRIISEVEDQIKSRYFTDLILTFIRTYYKEDFIEWFVNITEKNKMSIILIMKGQ